MNFSLIAFLLGRLSLALSAILLLPVGLAIFYEDGSFVEFAITSFTAFFVGLGFVQYGKFDEKENGHYRCKRFPWKKCKGIF